MRAAKVAFFCAVAGLLIGAVIVAIKAMVAREANLWARQCSDKSAPEYIQDLTVRLATCY